MDNKQIYENFKNLIKETEKELKPCPFCGGKVTMGDSEEGMGYDKEWLVRVSCQTKDCYTRKDMGLFSPSYSQVPYAEIMSKNSDTVIELVKRWNRRA